MKRRRIRYRRLITVVFLMLGIGYLIFVLDRGNVIHLHPRIETFPETIDSEKVGNPVEEESGIWIEVSYEQQKLYCYENDELLFSSDVVTGNEDTQIIPYGTYRVLYMTRDATLVGDDYEKHVDYWIGFDRETQGHMVGFHDASWRTKFGGDVWKSDPTLECINMPTDKVKQLYETVSVGTRIMIHD